MRLTDCPTDDLPYTHVRSSHRHAWHRIDKRLPHDPALSIGAYRAVAFNDAGEIAFPDEKHPAIGVTPCSSGDGGIWVVLFGLAFAKTLQVELKPGDFIEGLPSGLVGKMSKHSRECLGYVQEKPRCIDHTGAKVVIFINPHYRVIEE